jgi:hypothetical protein
VIRARCAPTAPLVFTHLRIAGVSLMHAHALFGMLAGSRVAGLPRRLAVGGVEVAIATFRLGRVAGCHVQVSSSSMGGVWWVADVICRPM